MAADRGNIPLALTMRAITKARMHGILWLYKSQRKAMTVGVKERQRMNEHKNLGNKDMKEENREAHDKKNEGRTN